MSHGTTQMIRQEIMREYINHDGGATAQLELPGNRTMAEENVSGAESLVHTLAGSGVDTCFTNPGTSEMHFVAALDRVPGVRCVLALFEGVATGAADGAMRGSLESRRQRCSIVGRVSLTVSLISTMRSVHACRW